MGIMLILKGILSLSGQILIVLNDIVCILLKNNDNTSFLLL